MQILALWRWWYAQGLQAAAGRLRETIRYQVQALSLGLVLRTLFAPWRQTVNIAGPNTPLQIKLRWWLGNQVSRFIGFCIRIGFLAGALSIAVITILGGVLLLLLWYVIPVLSVGLLVGGLVLLWM